MDDDYGMYDYDPKLFINIEKVWEVSETEDRFISNYCKLLHHEYLHYVIHDCLFNLFIDYEEFYVDKISGTNKLSYPKVTNKYVWQEVE